MKTFAQRKGLVPVEEVIQTSGMTAALRNSLWNVLDVALWSAKDFMYKQYGAPEIDGFSQALWMHFYKEPVDSRPSDIYNGGIKSGETLQIIREKFFAAQWYEVYEFIEYVVGLYKRVNPRLSLATVLNAMLEKESSGYRIVEGLVADITSQQEIDMLGEAIRDTRFGGVAGHLQRALELLADRENPDYRNSIKESISAVESMARIVAENQKAVLSDALKALERSGKLHTALKDGFLKLYAYTSDEQGIRHAMMDEPNITNSDAKYFLMSCTAFVNYLKAQLS